MIFGLMGGLGLFIYGVHLMGEGLQKVAGDRMRKILGKLTNNPVMGVLVGAGITAVIQSSSATTVMLVGFVNAGLMTLKQAVGVIMGANIGTTVTAQLIALKLTEYALPAIGIGFAFKFFSRKEKYKNIGEIILGFGLLFLGLNTMTGSVKFLRSSPAVKNIFIKFSATPVLGVLAGMIVTMVIQSSSATVGLTMALASSGLIGIYEAIPLLLGDNIGTCITAILASIGTTLSAKRSALAHGVFNIVGTIIVLIFLKPYTKIVLIIGGDIARQIANAHTLFNTVNTILLLPFVAYFIKLVVFLIPGEEKVYALGAQLDKRLLKTPVIALEQVKEEVLRMARTANEMIEGAMDSFFKKDRKKLQEISKKEKVVDILQKEITDYLVELSQQSLTPEVSKKINSSMHMIHDIERIGDHAENLAKLTTRKLDGNLQFTEDAYQEIRAIYQKAAQFLDNLITAIEIEDVSIASEAMEIEKTIDKMTYEYKNNHIARLNAGLCNVVAGLIFMDLINNFEKIGDHSYNIAEAILGIK